MIGAPQSETDPRRHRAGEEARIGIEITKITSQPAMIVEAEAEAREKNDRDDIPHHRTRRS